MWFFFHLVIRPNFLAYLLDLFIFFFFTSQGSRGAILLFVPPF